MIELTDEQATDLKQGHHVRIFVPKLGEDVVVILAVHQDSTESIRRSEADRMALANRTNVPRVLRKIANRCIARHYPITVAVGLEPQLEARGNTDTWILPLVYASPGYGDHGIVGKVGSITIDARTGNVIEITARDDIVAVVRKVDEESREAIEAAFHSAAGDWSRSGTTCYC
jgi:hypothetical protein